MGGATVESIHLKEYQKCMLRVNYRAGKNGITAGEMAKECGWKIGGTGGTASLHYGRLARKLGEALGMRLPPKESNKKVVLLDILCEEIPMDDDGHYLWIMQPKVRKALERLRIIQK